MRMVEWLVAGTLLIAFLAILPRLLRGARRSSRASGGSGVWIGIGLALSMVFDPKASHAIEMVDRKKDEEEERESGDKPANPRS
jgi:hypothetical protein